MLTPKSNNNNLVINFSTLIILVLKLITLLILIIPEFKVFIVTNSKIVIVSILDKIVIL